MGSEEGLAPATPQHRTAGHHHGDRLGTRGQGTCRSAAGSLLVPAWFSSAGQAPVDPIHCSCIRGLRVRGRRSQVSPDPRGAHPPKHQWSISRDPKSLQQLCQLVGASLACPFYHFVSNSGQNKSRDDAISWGAPPAPPEPRDLQLFGAEPAASSGCTWGSGGAPGSPKEPLGKHRALAPKRGKVPQKRADVITVISRFQVAPL